MHAFFRRIFFLSVCAFLMSTNALADQTVYRVGDDHYYSLAEAESAVLAKYDHPGWLVRDEERTTEPNSIIWYNFHSEANVTEPQAYYTGWNTSGYVSTEGEAYNDWDAQFNIGGYSNTTDCGVITGEITDNGWEFEHWTKYSGSSFGLTESVWAKAYFKDYHASIHQPYKHEPVVMGCLMNDYESELRLTRIELFRCQSSSLTPYAEGELPESGSPQCYNNTWDIISVTQCKSPFFFDESTSECVTYCPDSTEFDSKQGICRCKLGVCEQNQCAAKKLDPIDTGTGESYQPQKPDYVGSGDFPVRFSRNYKSFRVEREADYPSVEFGKARGWVRYVQPSNYSGGAKGYKTLDTQPIGHLQWRHSYQLSLRAVEGISVVLQRANGDEWYFSWLETDARYNSTGIKGGFVQLVGEQWQYTSPDGVIETYDSEGKLLRITKLSGLSQQMDYNADGLLSTVTDPAGRQLSFDYDEQGRLTSLLQPDGQQVIYSYGAYGNLIGVQYPDSTPESLDDNPVIQYRYENPSHPYALTSQYDENNNLYASWTFDAAGRATSSDNNGIRNGTVAYSEDSSGNQVATVTEANNHQQTLTFNSSGLLSSVTGGNCGSCGMSDVSTYGYDSQNRLTSKTDYNGVETRYEYNSRNLKIKVTEAHGTPLERVTTTEWHTDLSLPTKVTTPTVQIDYVYDAKGNLLSQTETDLVIAANPQRITTYSYNEAGLLTNIDGPRTDIQDVTSFGYDANGELHTVTDAVGHVTTIVQRNTNGYPIQITDANGVTTALSYDARNRLVQQTTASKNTHFTYDKVGQLTQIELPNGATTTYTYNGARLLTSITDGAGNHVDYSYDVMGNVTKVEIKDPAGQLHATQQMVYDGLNRLSQQTDGLNQSTVFGYDGVGNLTSTKSPALKEIKQVYDALNRLKESIDAKAGKTIYGYDGANNLISVQAPNQALTSYSYDGFGNLLQQISPDTGTTQFTYDVMGNQLTKTDAKNITTHFTYDALNRLTEIDYPDNNLDTLFSYDEGINGKGRLTQITDGSGSTQYGYNVQGLLASKTSTIQGRTFHTAYAYNDAGQLTQLTYPSGRVVTLIRDSQGQVTQVSQLHNGQSKTLLDHASYVPFGSSKTYTLGNGQTVDKSHNLNGQFTEILTPGVYQHQLTYDADSNVTQLVNPLMPEFQQSFNYDELDRLTEAYGHYGDIDYDYDSVGNRISKTLTNSSQTLQYSAESNQLSGDYRHNEVGSRTQDLARSYSYGDHGRLTEVVNETNGLTTNYLYNALGQRVMKTNLFGVTYYLYGEQGLLIAEADEQGQVEKEYIYFEGQPLVMMVGE